MDGQLYFLGILAWTVDGWFCGTGTNAAFKKAVGDLFLPKEMCRFPHKKDAQIQII